jgi:DNA-binding LytR/AlgR family response regulator
MRVIVVDDEQPAREELAWLLGQCEAVDVAGQFGSARDAAAYLEKGDEDIDLCFLDIDMPGLDGVRLAQLWHDRLADRAPLIAFVTAYEEHAVDAFSLDAVDYLLKPVRLSRLEKTLLRARRRLGEVHQPTSEIGDAPSSPLERISVEILGQYHVIATDKILWIEADEGFATVHTDQGAHLTDFSLKFLEENLDRERFFRCHRSYIVRLDAITRITPVGSGTYRLVVGEGSSDDQAIPLARSRAPELKARIPWSANVL